jgi:hypothetical protein
MRTKAAVSAANWYSSGVCGREGIMMEGLREWKCRGGEGKLYEPILLCV